MTAESGQRCTDVSLVQRQKEPLEAPSSRPESPELGAGAGRHPRGGRAVKPAGTLPSPLSLGGRPEGETLGEDGLVSATGAALGCTGWLARSCLKTPFSFQTRVLTHCSSPATCEKEQFSHTRRCHRPDVSSTSEKLPPARDFLGVSPLKQACISLEKSPRMASI